MSFVLMPLILLVVGMGLLLIGDLVRPSPGRSYTLALTTTCLALITQALAITLGEMSVWDPIEQALKFDTLGQGFSLLALLLSFLAIGISKDSFREENEHSGEYYTLLLAATLGGVLVAHARELLTFFVAFELLSIPLYVLAGFKRYHRKSSEAGLKYFLSGALSSALFLFGASWIIGASGSTQFSAIADGVTQGHGQPIVLGVLLVLVAFGFKMSLAPFHMWAPDTYEGAPIPVAAFISTVPKVAMVAVTVRLMLSLTSVLNHDMMVVIGALSILSILIGNLVALNQVELTRMAAFSGIAQMGYVFIGVAGLAGLDGAGRYDLSQEALGSLFFYLAVYTVTNMAFWLILLTVAKLRGGTTLTHFEGLSKQNPFLAFALMITLFSLAGVPPLAGFVGKVYLFRSAFYTLPLMALVGMLGSVTSLYYYFNILRRCYFSEPPTDEPLEVLGSTKVLLALLLSVPALGGLIPYLAQISFVLAERMLLQ